MCLVKVTSAAAAGAWADDETDPSPAMAQASGIDAAIPKRCRFMGRRLRPNRPIVNANAPPCKILRLARSKFWRPYMTRRFACLIAATLALTAAPLAVIFASPAARAGEAVDILVDGVAQPHFAHDGRWYVEARKGREYAIRLRNPYPVRVAVALSVDGLNTIDARETTAAAARKWVIDPYETVVISGWQTSQTDARRFEFTTEERSYGQALGKTANLGVISAVFFKERVINYLPDSSKDRARQNAPSASAPASASGAREESRAHDEYAATGMGRRTGHAVEQVWLNLEDRPSHIVDIRYEFRPQLVKLGVLPAPTADPLVRRERARGFEPGFCPEPPRKH